MRTNSASQSGTFNPPALLAFALSSVGVFLAMLSFAALPPGRITGWEASSPGNPLFVDQHAGPLSSNATATAAGSWAIVTSPNTSSTDQNVLSAVACTSASDCWAVGSYFNGIFFQTLIERWDGTSWAIVTSPNALPLQNNILTGVTCASASDCWAVGYYTLGNAFQTLIERWDGTSWTIVTSPNTTPTESNLLYGVTCASASDCWAVGFYSPASGTGLQTLIERWNGTSWTIVTSPNSSPTRTNFLTSVTCASASDCWTVGGRVPPSGTVYQTLIERWDGTSWAIVTSPNASPTRSSVLYAVTCVPASDCWAVGYQHNGIANQPLAQRWDGTSWAIVTAPYTNPNEPNSFFGLTCLSASDCWAVGYYGTPSSPRQTLTERWDGTAWTIVTSPNSSPTQYNTLAGVTCVSASDCWAVGSYVSGGAYHTLILRYTGSPSVELLSVVSSKVHGSEGPSEVELPLTGSPGIECRTGGANGDHTLIYAFANALTSVGGASVTSGTGSISGSAIDSNDARNYIVNLTGVPNAQTITVSLANVNDSAGNSSASVSASMGVLLGDTTSNGSVNSSDISQTKAQSGQAVTATNFRQDVTVNGSINSSDISLVKSKSGTALP